MKKQEEQNPLNGKINRYYRNDHVETEWRDDEDGGGEVPVDIEVRYFDRVTGEQVFSYDGADPANRPPLGPSDEECFANKGLDIHEEIDVSQCKVAPTPAELSRWAWMQAQKAEKEQEIERGVVLLGELDLFTYLELDASAFDFDRYEEHEQNMLKPALERKGFSRVAFFMGEQDSFGPLSRGIRAWKDDKGFVFYYG